MPDKWIVLVGPTKCLDDKWLAIYNQIINDSKTRANFKLNEKCKSILVEHKESNTLIEWQWDHYTIITYYKYSKRFQVVYD